MCAMLNVPYAECRCGECRGAKKNYGLTPNRKKSYSRRIKIRPVKVCLHGRLESQNWDCVFAVYLIDLQIFHLAAVSGAKERH
jgi:hypothetical protein